MLLPVTEHASDAIWMREALSEAKLAACANEVPVGAVVVLHDKIIGRGANAPISRCDPSAHAEIIALREAAQVLGNYRMLGASVYVTLEPCTMCLGALMHARVERLIYGAAEPKAGVIESRTGWQREAFFNHSLQVTGGVLAEKCAAEMSAFFKARREQKKRLKTERVDLPQQ